MQTIYLRLTDTHVRSRVKVRVNKLMASVTFLHYHFNAEMNWWVIEKQEWDISCEFDQARYQRLIQRGTEISQNEYICAYSSARAHKDCTWQLPPPRRHQFARD